MSKLLLVVLLSIFANIATADETCSCKKLLDRAEAILNECMNATGEYQLACLDNHAKASTAYENCQLALIESIPAGKNAGAVCTKVTPPKKPPVSPPPQQGLGDCGFTVNRLEDVPKNVSVDNYDQLIDNFNDFMGGIKTDSSTGFQPKIDENGKISDPQLHMNVSLNTPRVTINRTTPADKVLMDKASELARGHELRHMNLSIAKHKEAACKMIGMTEAQAEAAFKKLTCVTLPKVNRSLDLKEGNMAPVIDPKTGNVTDIKLVPMNRKLKDYVPKPPAC